MTPPTNCSGNIITTCLRRHSIERQWTFFDGAKLELACWRADILSPEDGFQYLFIVLRLSTDDDERRSNVYINKITSKSKLRLQKMKTYLPIHISIISIIALSRKPCDPRNKTSRSLSFIRRLFFSITPRSTNVTTS